jgi:hypothetical protein
MRLIESELGENEERMLQDYVNATDKYERAIAVQPEAASPREEGVPRIERPRRTKKAAEQPPAPITRRKRVNERWFYEPRQEESKALRVNTQPQREELDDEVGQGAKSRKLWNLYNHLPRFCFI